MAELGLFMGTRVNGAGDAMDFEPFLDRWINPIIGAQGRLDYDWQGVRWWDRWRAASSFKNAMGRFQAEHLDGQPWGWKNPRSMYVLPAIAATIPRIRFIHVVRDGRDMAFSDNQNQRRKHYQALFGDTGKSATAPETPAASAALWSTANIQVADWAEAHLGSARYQRIKLEDLCAEPVETVTKLSDWLFATKGDNAEAISAAAATVRAPSSLGRWQSEPSTEQDAVTEAAKPALQRFGYIGSGS